MSNIIRLTENDLHNMIFAATKQLIKEIEEITTHQAAIVGGANASAFNDYTQNGTSEAETKMNRADLLRLPAITKALIDSFGNFKIKLVEYNPDNHYGYVNYFVFDCIVLIDDKSCVMKGELSIGGRPYSIGYIKYSFEDNTFYRVRCGDTLRVSIIAQLEPFKGDVKNIELTNGIINSLNSFLTQESNLRDKANNTQIPPSKPRKPLSAQSRNRLYGDYLKADKKRREITPIEKI